MRPVPFLLAISAALVAGACTTAEERDRRSAERQAAAELSADGTRFADGAQVTGAAENCVPIAQIRQSNVRSDRVIDWRMTDNRWYRTVLPQSCPMLGFEQRFAYSTSITQLCAQDIITVLQGPQAQPGAACGLAPFRPIEPPRRR